MTESVNVEFKELDRESRGLPSSTAKELISFANTEGGNMYFGIADDGSVTGVDNPEDVMSRIASLVHDSILPDLMPFIQIRPVKMEGKNVVRVTVSIGTERPYYLRKEGLRPSGVFVRRGSACFPLNEAGIREMIMETSGKSYEESRSQIQNLTFNTLKDELRSKSMNFGPSQMRTLKMIGEDRLFNNLALLLSDQCTHTIKVAVFQGTDGSIFRARREFSGSVLKQLNDVYEYIDGRNEVKATFSGLLRTDQRDYPETAVRETLLNCIIHRDYLPSGSTIINIYRDHMEFLTLGGLVSGLTMDAVFLGMSDWRNPNLASVFLRLGLVEGYGTGVRKIRDSYKGAFCPPEFRAVGGAFKVTLFNRNERESDCFSGDLISEPHIRYAVNNVPRNELAQEILRLAEDKGTITRKDVQDSFNVGSTKAFLCLKMLCDSGKLRQQKMGRLSGYSVD